MIRMHSSIKKNPMGLMGSLKSDEICVLMFFSLFMVTQVRSLCF